MTKVELKTQKNDKSVQAFLEAIPDPDQKADCLIVDKMMQKASGEKGAMWGASIVGYGTYHYKSPGSNREADWMRIGFSPRKGQTTLYLSCGFDPVKDLMTKLGKHSTGKGCLYIKHLEDVDQDVLQKVIDKAFGSLAQAEV